MRFLPTFQRVFAFCTLAAILKFSQTPSLERKEPKRRGAKHGANNNILVEYYFCKATMLRDGDLLFFGEDTIETKHLFQAKNFPKMK